MRNLFEHNFVEKEMDEEIQEQELLIVKASYGGLEFTGEELAVVDEELDYLVAEEREIQAFIRK